MTVAKKLITESDIVEAARRGTRSISIDPQTVITPSAKDAALQYKIEFTTGVPASNSSKTFEAVEISSHKDSRNPNASTIIALGSDHGGFPLKKTLKQYLLDAGYTVADVGTTSEEACDYPDFAYAVASLVASGQASKGIMVDAVGVASAIVANKVTGIRAVPCYSEFVARSSREHNDANVLTLGGRVLGTEIAKSIVKVWLETWFGGGRHQARVKKISDIEKKFTGSK
ncbi:MAG: ribose 5-phosphate isomerase B [Ignavibacteriales bacterium]|nr:ribose 5-phosphate isomerase B [Ignavibacteriales bacterium]